MEERTVNDETRSGGPDHVAVPGVVLVYSTDRPQLEAIPLRRGALDLGRDELEAMGLTDPRVSRRHLSIAYDGAAWSTTDHGSTNGTWVDGERLQGSRTDPSVRVVRIGRTLLLPTPDITPHTIHGMQTSSAALWERPAEVPWLIVRAIASVEGAASLYPDVQLVERCLLRRWPGDIRELSGEIRRAAALAVTEGTPTVESHHLAQTAGRDLEPDGPLST